MIRPEIDPNIRRLPVYMLVDCSSSMNGDAIEAVDQGFKNLTVKLRTNPYTSDIVWFSIISFDSIPRQMIPLCPLGEYRGAPFKIGGSSNLGRALIFLRECVDQEVRKQSAERGEKGDWRPLVFLMSDGRPTDNWEAVAAAVSKEMNFVACGVGIDVNIDMLKKVTRTVVLMKDLTQETFNQFIDFLGATMTTASHRSDSQSDGLSNMDSCYSNIKIILS